MWRQNASTPCFWLKNWVYFEQECLASHLVKGKQPTCVERISTVYEKGVRLTKSAMQQIETQIERLSELKRWFVTIPANTVSSSFGRF
jgi:hypothetical protein